LILRRFDVLKPENIIGLINHVQVMLQHDIDFPLNIFMEHMGDEVSAFDENTIEEWFINNQDLNVFEDYKDIIFTDNDSLENFNNIICDIAPEFLDLDKKSKFKRILRNIFVQIMVLENYTGVAIVGFERDKLFPSCTLFKIRYIYDDKFIFDEITNDEVGKKAVIFAPLAQLMLLNHFSPVWTWILKSI